MRHEAQQRPAEGERPRAVENLHFTRVVYAAGDVILEEGSTVEAYFYVVMGNVRITQDSEFVTDKGKGAHFEHLTTRASETVTASERTMVVKIDKLQFDQHVRPTLLDGAEIGHYDLAGVLTVLLASELQTQAFSTRSGAVSFLTQLVMAFVLVFGFAVLAMNLALDDGWKPWQTCNSCDRDAPEPTTTLWLLNGVSLAFSVGAATLGKRWMSHG